MKCWIRVSAQEVAGTSCGALPSPSAGRCDDGLHKALLSVVLRENQKAFC